MNGGKEKETAERFRKYPVINRDLPDNHRRALKFYASVRLDVRRINMIKICGNGSGTEPA